MPYVKVSTSKHLSESEITALKGEIGKIIEIIPGKAEWGLMVEIVSGAALFFGGHFVDCAFVDTRVHGETALEIKEKYTIALYGAIERAANIPSGQIYTNFLVCDTWGAFGALH